MYTPTFDYPIMWGLPLDPMIKDTPEPVFISGDVIAVSEVKAGDTIEFAGSRYFVHDIMPAHPLHGGYQLELTRVSDALRAFHCTPYVPKFVILLNRS